MDDIGDGAPMDETPSNTSLLSFDLGSGLTPKMSWLASRTRDGLLLEGARARQKLFKYARGPRRGSTRPQRPEELRAQ